MDELIVKGSYHGERFPAYEVHKSCGKYVFIAEYWDHNHLCWVFDNKDAAMTTFNLMCDNDGEVIL